MSSAVETVKKVRMNWLDGARLAAAFCIIGIHTSSDSRGGAFQSVDTAERVFPVLMRSVSELASTEFFILVSLFLLSMKLSKEQMPYVETMLQQAKRLLIPFVVWTIFYAFFRLYKAHYLGYSHGIYNELSSVSHWVGYFILGKANFHMHFLPTLFMLLLFHRVYKLAIPYPMLGLLILPMLYLNAQYGDWLWSTIKDPLLRDYVARGLKIVTYTGYGFFAYSLYGIWQRGIDRDLAKTLFGLCAFLIAVAFSIKMIYAQKVGISGQFIVRREFIFYGHFLLPCIMLSAFMCSFFLNWPDKLSQWSRFSFGMYLVHPAVIDLLEIAQMNWNLQPDMYVLYKYCATAFLSLSITMAIGKVKLLAWTVGLGPLPSFNNNVKQPTEAVA